MDALNGQIAILLYGISQPEKNVQNAERWWWKKIKRPSAQIKIANKVNKKSRKEARDFFGFMPECANCASPSSSNSLNPSLY